MCPIFRWSFEVLTSTFGRYSCGIFGDSGPGWFGLAECFLDCNRVDVDVGILEVVP